MSSDNRPICGNAILALKKNSTKLMVVICFGIVLAMCGIYVQSSGHSNPIYTPSISTATNWLSENIGNRLLSTGQRLMGCPNRASQGVNPTASPFLVRILVRPIVHYSGAINGLIHISQLIILKIYCRSACGTNAIIALSATGLLISMICIGGAYAACKWMCISCLGVHHGVIIYLAYQRRQIINNIHCPQNINNIGSCSVNNSNNNGGITGKIFGNANNTTGTGTPKANNIKRRTLGSRGF